MLETPQSDRGIVVEGDATISQTDGAVVREEEVEESVNCFGTVGRANEFFAREAYRPGQREVIDEIERAFEDGYRYVVVQAPTGSGKSEIGRAFAFQSGDAYVLTPQKILQDQYQRSFPEMFVMKGRGAYEAFYQEHTDDMDLSVPVTCADCVCRRTKMDTSVCPYKQAKMQALREQVVAHNFDSFLYQNMFGSWPGRKLLVIDEAHSIEGKVSAFMAFSVSSRFIPGLHIPQYNSLEEYDEFFLGLIEKLAKKLANLNEIKETGMMDKSQVTLFDRLTRLQAKMKGYLREREAGEGEEYVFDFNDRDGYETLTLRPVFARKYARRLLFGFGRRTLMMSATILDHEQFCHNIGLDPDEVYYIEKESFFPEENSRIVVRNVGPMTYKKIDNTLPKVVEAIEDIVRRFPGRKGIVQTHSEKISEYIRYNTTDQEVLERFTFNKDYRTADETLKVHEAKEGSIIVASGLREGIDLKGDLSQVQVFCKVPYPSLGDKQVARRKDLDPDWYGYVTMLYLVQAIGRSIRSETDKAVTFVLDSGFGWFYKRHKYYMPKHIRSSIVWPRKD